MRSFVVLSIVALAGCVASSGDPEKSGTTDSSIINGGTSPQTARYNAVELPGCSAVALDEEWVLTARHCTCQNGSLNWPCTTSLQVGVDQATRANPVESSVIREVHQYPNADLALLRMQTPFSTMANHNELWDGPMPNLAGKALYCLGQGDNLLPFGGSGTWRDATMSVADVDADGYTFWPNAQGQIQWMGDSGGPCIYQTSTTQYVTGIQSTATWECATPWGCDKATAIRVTSTHQAGLTATASAWVRDARERSPLFFYGGNAGYVSMLERQGGYTDMHRVDGFANNWTSVVVLHDDALFFYDKNSGTAATATLDKWGNYRGGATIASFARPGYTQIVSVGRDGVFLFDANQGTGVIARVDGTGAYTQTDSISGFTTNWTHVAATTDGGLFFYDKINGIGATATVDANLHYATGDTIYGFSPGFTNVIGIDHGGLLFYSASNGGAYASQIDVGGHYHGYGPVTGLPAGATFVVGASNAGLFLLDGSGTATIGRVAAGQYSYVSTLSGFSSWTTVSAN
jgi:hypothetical protein